MVGVGESSGSKCGIIPHLLPFEFIAIPPKFVSKSRKRAMLFFGLAGIFESLKMDGKGFFMRGEGGAKAEAGFHGIRIPRRPAAIASGLRRLAALPIPSTFSDPTETVPFWSGSS